MRATRLAFEKRFLDDSGVQFAVRLNGDQIYIESINIAIFPLEELDWLIRALSRIKEEICPAMGKSQNLVYFPPLDKFYYMQNDGTIYEFTYNRSNPALRITDTASAIPGESHSRT